MSWRKISIGGSNLAKGGPRALVAFLLRRALEQLGAEAALVVFGDHRAPDFVADLTQPLPIREASVDTALLLNVLEHVYDGRILLKTLAAILKPGGVLLIAIPFMVKMHQVPVDLLSITGSEHPIMPQIQIHGKLLTK